MKKILTIISIVAVAAVSCTKSVLKDNSTSGTGELSMNMSLSDMTRAMSDSDLLSSATVKIYKADFSGLVRSYNYGNIPSPFYLVADEYRVDVEAGEAVAENPNVASWDNKSYKGSQEFTIVAGQVTNVQVVANVNNAVTNITFDASVSENFNDGYKFTIGLDESSQLVYDLSKSGSEGYFIVAGLDEPSFNWTFSGTLAKDGSAFTKSGVIEGLQPGKLYKMNLKYTIKDGDLNFTLSVDYTTEDIEHVIIFEPVSTGISPSSPFEIWAGHATLHADVDAAEFPEPSVQFAYAAEGQEFTYVDGVNDSEGTWKADISGLTPLTKYTYMLIIDGVQQGDPATFTTAEAKPLPNGSFEYVSKVTNKDFYKFYDPNCNVEEGSYKFWGSGNGDEEAEGSASYKVITTIDENDKVHGDRSVVLTSQWAVVKFAAGNIFTGSFAGLVGTSGGMVNFGRPWKNLRPTSLKLHCKYITGAINRVDKTPPGETIKQNETMDEAEIKVALGTWNYKEYGGTKESPVQVNTTKSETFIDYSTDPNTIAYGDLILHHDGFELNYAEKESKVTSEWQVYEIPLIYNSLTDFPTHIIISCASSRFGDYFTGCDTAKLWIDAVELIYE